MSGTCDDDDYALKMMAGLGPVEENIPPESKDASETKTATTRVAAGASESPPPKVTISFREALAIIGVSRNTLYSSIGRNEIPGVRKLGGTWRFHHQTLLDWLACK